MVCSTLKLIIEKGPREGESLEYSSGSVIKIGRVVRGNTIGIKDAGISSKHVSIQFDNELSKWNLTDLDSSNGTILNGQLLLPNVPSTLDDGDCIKIGELTSIVVKIGVQSTIPSERNPRRQAKSGAAATVAGEQSGLMLGLDGGDLGENAVEQPVQKRNLRPRAKRAVDSKNEVENVIPKRTLRSSKKEENVSFIPSLNQIPEDTNADVRETSDQIVLIERKLTRARTKKLLVEPPTDPDKGKPADIVVEVDVKKTRRGRKRLPVEPLEELQASDSVRVDTTENVVENSGMKENLEANNESAQDHVAEGCERQEAMVDQSLETGVDTSRWQDLEKMTLGDFFDYLEWYLPKEIREKTEEIISQLPEKARKYREVRLQHEKGKGKQTNVD